LDVPGPGSISFSEKLGHLLGTDISVVEIQLANDSVDPDIHGSGFRLSEAIEEKTISDLRSNSRQLH
jgi:hypothetical protein